MNAEAPNCIKPYPACRSHATRFDIVGERIRRLAYAALIDPARLKPEDVRDLGLTILAHVADMAEARAFDEGRGRPVPASDHMK